MENGLAPARRAGMLRAVNFWQGLQDLLIKISLRVGNQNRLVYGAKQGQVRLAIAQADGGEAGSEAGAVELDQFAHGAAFIGAEGEMPETSAEGQGDFSPRGFLLEGADGSIARAGEEEWLVEIALPGKLGVARPEAGVLSDFAGRHIVEADHGDSGGFGNLFERGERFSVGARQGETQIARVTLDAGDFQVEVAVGDEYTAAVFCDEGMGVAELAAKRLDFRAGLTGDEDERDAAALDFRERRFRAGPGISARVEEGSVEIGKDKMPGGEHAALYPSRVPRRSPVPWQEGQLTHRKRQFLQSSTPRDRRGVLRAERDSQSPFSDFRG